MGRSPLNASVARACSLVTAMLLTGCAQVQPARDALGRAVVEPRGEPWTFAAPETDQVRPSDVRVDQAVGIEVVPLTSEDPISMVELIASPGGGSAQLAIDFDSFNLNIRAFDEPRRYLGAFWRPHLESPSKGLISAARYAPFQSGVRGARAPRGTILLLSSLVPFSPLETGLVASARERGWEVVVIAGSPSSRSGLQIGDSAFRITKSDRPFTARTTKAQSHSSEPFVVSVKMDLKAAIDLLGDELVRLLADYFFDLDFLGRAYVARQLLGPERSESQPLIVIGTSHGALATPTVVGGLRALGITPSAIVMVTGGCDVACCTEAVARQFEAVNATMTLERREALCREATALDPDRTSDSCDGIRTLLVLSSNDVVVPTACGQKLRDRLGAPETWTYNLSHEMIFTLPWLGNSILDWIEPR